MKKRIANLKKSKNEYRALLLPLYKNKGIDITNCHWATETAKDMFMLGIIEYSDFTEQKNVYDKDITQKKAHDNIASSLSDHISEKWTGTISTVWITRYCKYFGCSADYLLGLIGTPLHTPFDDIPLSFKAISSINSIKQRSAYLQKQADKLAEYGHIYKPHDTMGLLNHIIANPVFEHILCYIEEYIYPEYSKPIIAPNGRHGLVIPSTNNQAYKRPRYDDKGVLVTDKQGKPVYDNYIPLVSDDLKKGYHTIQINDSFLESVAMLQIQKAIDTIKSDYLKEH